MILSLCDRTGNMIKPWAEAGHKCMIVDLQHPGGESEFAENVTAVGADINTWIPPREPIEFIAAFPPCTHLAVSGARWMKEKGMTALIEGLTLVNSCHRICEHVGCRYMIENPISTLSTYWREPDHTFHPWEFAAYFTATDSRYFKKTCLWTGNGFIMPRPLGDPPEDNADAHRIWRMGPSDDRADLRAETPLGFAYAVYEANCEVTA